ncbi:MAG: aldehyde ferredoxin oxidoreductase family protein [Anaerolineales bacterium]|nr:aldehyde ferredoxin oxidoreductase family protein [Anaerolineales bacterium]
MTFDYDGYAGAYLRVDLSTGQIQKHSLPSEWVENYLGGNGIGIKILWDEVPETANPLGPDNKLIVATGPLCGSPMPNSGRMEFIGKSPLTGIYGDANAGGQFGPELKFSGYDVIIFEGQASEPVYLYINNDQVELRSARDIWGLGTYAAETRLQTIHCDPALKTALIGPAGENLVRFAGIQVTYRRSAARCGLGAVMGSKKLKGVAVRGTKGIHFKKPKVLESFSLQMHKNIRRNEFFPGIQKYGTSGLVALMQPIGRFPTQNFRQGHFEEYEAISGETLREAHLVRDIACFNCPLGCDKMYSVEEGEFAGCQTSSVEYETLNSLGARICNRNLEALLKANEMCDDLGLDSISAGNAISFAMELAELGIWKESELNGLDLSWGNYHTAIQLLHDMSYRQGFLGDLLADGAARAARWLGRNSERYAMHVKGQDIPAQDGRAQQSMGLAHVTSSRGADHLKAFPTIDETGYPSEAVRRYGEQYLPDLVNPLATRYKAMLVKDGEDFGAIVDSSGNCKSGGTFVMAEIYWQEQADAIAAATSMDIDAQKLRQIGERIYNLQRCYNALHGITSSDDVLPWRFTKVPSPSGNARGSVCHLEIMLPEYYAIRGWNPDDGLPTLKTMQRLGLEAEYQRMEHAIACGATKAARMFLGWAAPYTEKVEEIT